MRPLHCLWLSGLWLAAGPAFSADDCAARCAQMLVLDVVEATPAPSSLASGGLDAGERARSRSLLWQAAQLRAMAGDLDGARRCAQLALGEDDDDDAHPLRWNDYVHATLAFLDGDRERFDGHHAALRDTADAHEGNAVNLRLLDRLAQRFGDGYAAAVAFA